jgi:hypothetical protein
MSWDNFSNGGFGYAEIIRLVTSGICARLGATTLSAAAKASDILSWQAAFDNIFVLGGIPNYQGADAASFRFGITPGEPGVVDSAANYWWRSIFCPAGGATLTDNPNASATLIQLGEKTTKERVFAFHLFNLAGRNKPLKAWNAIGTASAATVGDAMVSLEGQYFNPDAGKLPIQCMQMVTLTNNMGLGSQFSVWGLNSI